MNVELDKALEWYSRAAVGIVSAITEILELLARISAMCKSGSHADCHAIAEPDEFCVQFSDGSSLPGVAVNITASQ